MNRRGFLKFLTVAPVAAPLAASATAQAAAMPAAVGKPMLISSMSFGGIDWSRFDTLFGKPITRWERDTCAFNSGISNIKATFSYAEKLPSVVSAVIEKTADLALDHLTELTEPKSALETAPQQKPLITSDA